MSAELTRPSDDEHRWEIADPFSGDLVSIEDPEVAAVILGRIRISEDAIRQVKRRLEERLLEAMDAEARWTLRFGKTEATAPSPDAAGELVWEDVDGLMTELSDAGLPDSRIAGDPDSLIQITVSKKVSKREADRIAKANPELREIIERHQGRKDKTRHVSVKLGV